MAPGGLRDGLMREMVSATGRNTLGVGLISVDRPPRMQKLLSHSRPPIFAVHQAASSLSGLEDRGEVCKGKRR